MEDTTSVTDTSHVDDVVVPGQPLPQGQQTPEFKVTEDQNQIEHGGRKYVREEALINERRSAQEMRKTIEGMAPLMPEFEEFLQEKRSRSDAPLQRTQQPDSEYTQDELEGLATVRGFKNQDGTLDLRRAQQELDIMTGIADRRAGKVAQPIVDQTTRAQADANYAEAMNAKFPTDGQPLAAPEFMRAAFEALPAHYRANPEIAAITKVVAVGLQTLHERSQGKRTTREPQFREGAAGRVDRNNSEALDALDRAAARARGMTDEQWSKAKKDTTGSQSLEDLTL